MAAFDTFEVIVEGQGSHGAMPHQGIDPISVSAQLYQAWQLIVSRSVSPTDAAVISVTQIHAGDTWNVVPNAVTLRGTVRTLRPQTRDMIEARMAERANLICRAFGARAALSAPLSGDDQQRCRGRDRAACRGRNGGGEGRADRSCAQHGV